MRGTLARRPGPSLLPTLAHFIQALARKLGVDLRRWSPQTSPVLRRAALLRTVGVDLLLDVGANDGRYGRELRTGGYAGRIVSFEPVPSAYDRLVLETRRDAAWECHPLALGSDDGEAEINVAENTETSSFLPAADSHLRVMPAAGRVDRTRVGIRRLDSVLPELSVEGTRPFLKLDVQGFESQVLDGAQAVLRRFAGLEVELSLVPLYEGEPGFRVLLDRIESEGFTLVGLEPHFIELDTGRTIQLDGLFLREPPPLGSHNARRSR